MYTSGYAMSGLKTGIPAANRFQKSKLSRNETFVLVKIIVMLYTGK
jgi:hypothetical protein